MTKKTLFFLVVLVIFSLGFGFSAISQEEVSPEITEAVNLDEDIQPEDLEVGEPRILPGHPLYFLKNWARSIRLFFAFRPVTKAELRLKFANERLIEVKKIIEVKRDPNNIKKGIENYQQEIEKIKAQTERIRERARENQRVEGFLDKFLHQEILHQKLLSKLEDQVPSEAFEKIKEARERHLESFQEVMLKLEDRKEIIAEKLDETLEKQKGSKYKNFKNLEILLQLEEKVPEEAKEAIRKAQENSLKRLKGDLEKMSPEDQERFERYLEGISGEEEKQLEIMENLRLELRERTEIGERIIRVRERIMERVRERVEELKCPEIEKPAPDFCREGRIIIKRDEEGCIISFDCLIPADIEISPKPEKPAACITLWNPVCSKDGKTYSNACFAKLAGAEIAYKGKCKEVECTTDADCPQPRCGPAGTISARCINVEAKCIGGKCQIQATP
ncbi:hypothetical protein KJA14_02025 [Patescibacteria group bacterium]|nr:hypothetical protein [Patescibacteria group bacterium]